MPTSGGYQTMANNADFRRGARTQVRLKCQFCNRR